MNNDGDKVDGVVYLNMDAGIKTLTIVTKAWNLKKVYGSLTSI